MELLNTQNTSLRLLALLNHVLVSKYPHIDRAGLGLTCGLQRVRWWSTEHDDAMDTLRKLSCELQRRYIPDIALQIAHHTQLTDLGMMGYAMLTSTTVEQAIQTAFHALYQAAYPVLASARIEEGIAHIDFTCAEAEPQFNKILLDIGMLSSWRYVQSLLKQGLDSTPEQVSFVEPHSVFAGSYEYFFGCPIAFGQPSNTISVRAKHLTQRIPTGDLQQLLDCNIQMRQLLLEQHHNEGIVGRVRTALIERPLDCAFNLDNTAAILNLNPHSLRRHLSQNGTTFRDLANEVRMNLAKQYLSSTAMPVKQIAYQLSYLEPNNFIRAFSRYTGLPPREFRRRSAFEAVTNRQ